MSHKKRLLTNMTSLFVLQVANYLLPLITVPYLVRVLGPDRLGLITFAQAFVQYFVVLTDYGFNLSATREIAIHRENVRKVSEIFCSVLFIKAVLMIIGFALMAAIVFTVPKFRLEWSLYFLVYFIVPGNVLFPAWFFQGMERMKYITMLNIVARSFMVLAIFIFVNNVDDYLIAAGLQASSMILTGLLGLLVAPKIVPITLVCPTKKQLKSILGEGWHIFISTVAINLYTSSNVFILGLLTNNVLVGYFSAADKIIRAVQGLLGTVSQAVYPHISALAAKSSESALFFIGRIIKLQGLGALIVSTLIILLAEPIVRTLLGEQYLASIPLLQWMSFLPFIIALSNIFGVQILFAFGYSNEVIRFQIPVALISLAVMVVVVYKFGLLGAVLNIVATEIVITAGFFVIALRKIRGLKCYFFPLSLK
ncbi:MAG: flippase [Eubacteriales bacterium]